MGIIDHNLNLDDAFDLVETAISGKIGILSKKGNVLKVGAPILSATISISPTKIEISGAKPIASTAESEIQRLLRKKKQDAERDFITNSAHSKKHDASMNIMTEKDCLFILKSYKEIYDLGLISEDLFKKAKEKYLILLENFLNDKNHLEQNTCISLPTYNDQKENNSAEESGNNQFALGTKKYLDNGM